MRMIGIRTAKLAITLLIMSFFVFFCTRIIPGDPILLMYGDKPVSDAVIEKTRELYHLNDPVLTQYFNYMKGVLHGDFGYSYFYVGKPVLSVLQRGFQNTLRLTAVAFPVSVIAGLLTGVFITLFNGTKIDGIYNGIVAFFTSIPDAPFAAFLVFIFAVKLRLFPIAGWGKPEHLVLPVLFLSSWQSLHFSKTVRSLLVNEWTKPYVFMCRSRGMSKIRILLLECLPNAVIPLTTQLGMMFGRMLEGALIAELVFNIPGFARLSVDAIFRRDYPVIMAVVLLGTLIYTTLNYSMEILQTVLDPRLREVQDLE